MTAAAGDGKPVATQQVGLMVKLWPEVRDAVAHGERLVPTIEEVQALGNERYSSHHEKRRMSPAARDLLALGKAAHDAGYLPGDTIPPKRKRAR